MAEALPKSPNDCVFKVLWIDPPVGDGLRRSQQAISTLLLETCWLLAGTHLLIAERVAGVGRRRLLKSLNVWSCCDVASWMVLLLVCWIEQYGAGGVDRVAAAVWTSRRELPLLISVAADVGCSFSEAKAVSKLTVMLPILGGVS
ncbi:hypothetical protein LR48_Vigan07g044300 [Vigna angularis]|uniref:Uncharacterized protein n=1 Tax=Phaseolus angularis TaxID=3914 RepID=A0A0L9UW16_PHAAN|nr:hypothetical protein LR48_Vigan07g044300 [Vigna angularis]